jgi:DNA-binding NarL/FixJ family response regulator
MAEPGAEQQPTRVLIVDDHDLFRTGLSSLFASQSDFEIVAQASGGRMAIRLARELRPDVILMDLQMPDVGGEEATRAILEDDPSARIVILTVASDEPAVAGAIRAGACGYLVKDTPIDDVVTTVRAAARGGAWLSPEAAGALVDRVRRERAEPTVTGQDLESLSSRELEVLRLVAQGCENSEIARDLGISARTAKNHVSSILEKLELKNRVQAAVFAAQRGLV